MRRRLGVVPFFVGLSLVREVARGRNQHERTWIGVVAAAIALADSVYSSKRRERRRRGRDS